MPLDYDLASLILPLDILPYFEVTINGKKQILSIGDGFYAEPDADHGVICLESGILLDSFSPVRKDFLK